MSKASGEPHRNLLSGIPIVFLAESVYLPAGVMITAFLTRKLGAGLLGDYLVLITVIIWFEAAINDFFASSTIKFVAEATEWKSVSPSVLQVPVSVALLTAACVYISAPVIAHHLKEPSYASNLRLFAWDIPIFVAAKTHRHILIGLGRFTERACGGLAFWLTKLALVIVLVALNQSVRSALIATMAASAAELCYYRWRIRAPIFGNSTLSRRRLIRFSSPLFLSSLCMMTLLRADLIAVKVLGAGPFSVGLYGAAHTLFTGAWVLALTFAPLFLSTLSSLLRHDLHEDAVKIVNNSIRYILCLLPLCAIVSGAATDICRLIFGTAFTDSGDILGLTIMSIPPLALIYAINAAFTASGRRWLTVATNLPILLIAFTGYLYAVPRFGTSGAAFTMMSSLTAGSLHALMLFCLMWKNPLPWTAMAKSLVISGVAFAMVNRWHTGPVWMFIKIFAATACVMGSYRMTGLLSKEDLLGIRELLAARFRANKGRPS